MSVRYADHEETIGAGDVFYMPPDTFRRTRPAPG